MEKLREHNITLNGGLIVVRPLTEGDWDILLKWNSDPEVVYYTDDRDVTSYTIEEVHDIWRSVSQNAFCFIIEFEGSPIGEGWLQRMNLERLLEQFPDKDCRRIDLMIGEKQLWGRGIGTQVIGMLTEFGFEKEKADAIFGIVHGHNPRSRRAFEKNGYTVYQEVPQPEGGKAKVSYDLTITREDFEKMKNAHSQDAQRQYFIKGHRVGLCLPVAQDVQMHYELWQDPVVQRNFNSPPPGESFEDWHRWYSDPERRKGMLTATVVRLQDEQPIGVISLRKDDGGRDVSIILCRDWRAQGYGAEAVALIADYAFRQERVQCLTAGAYEFNQASIRILEKVGFARDPDQDQEEEDAWQGGKTVQLAFRLDRASWERSRSSVLNWEVSD